MAAARAEQRSIAKGPYAPGTAVPMTATAPDQHLVLFCFGSSHSLSLHHVKPDQLRARVWQSLPALLPLLAATLLLAAAAGAGSLAAAAAAGSVTAGAGSPAAAAAAAGSVTAAAGSVTAAAGSHAAAPVAGSVAAAAGSPAAAAAGGPAAAAGGRAARPPTPTGDRLTSREPWFLNSSPTL